MKVKKDSPKIKKKNKLETTTNSSIKKIRKKRVKKVQNNSEIADAVKKGFEESQIETGSKVPLRQQTWNAYLKVFLASEKLNKKQKQIMEFCTSKSVTPPRRKQKFLNFVRNCYEHQKDITDELCNELFDLVLKKYDDYKTGKYSALENNEALLDDSSAPKSSRNKKKKLNPSANNDVKNSSVDKTEKKEEKWEKTKLKKRKPQKYSSESDEDDDDEMDD